MSKKVKIQFVVTTPHQVVYEVSDDFQLGTFNVYEAVKEVSNHLNKDILIDFEDLADQQWEDGTVVEESVGVDFIEVKNSNNIIESFLESDN
jgi:hypothetical protein